MNKKGFTLIELLVVVAIIGLLSTLAVVALSSARLKARDSKRLSDLKQIQTALELYYTDKSEYPTEARPRADFWARVIRLFWMALVLARLARPRLLIWV